MKARRAAEAAGSRAMPCRRRGWLSGDKVWLVYLPAWTGILDVPVVGPAYLAYCDWWVTLAVRHPVAETR